MVFISTFSSKCGKSVHMALLSGHENDCKGNETKIVPQKQEIPVHLFYPFKLITGTSKEEILGRQRRANCQEGKNRNPSSHSNRKERYNPIQLDSHPNS